MTKKPFWLALAFAISGCGSSGGGTSVPVATETPVPFQSPAGTSLAYGASEATAAFTAGTGTTATGAPEPADTAGNTVTLATDGSGALINLTVAAAATNGGAPTVTNLAINEGVFDNFLANAAEVANVVALAAVANPPQMVYQGVSAGLSYSAYGLWAENTHGASYNVGVFALGSETTAAQMATLIGTASYSGSTLGFGTNGSAPFTFSGTAGMSVNFSTATVTNLTLSNFTTQDVNDANAGPTLPNLAGAGAIVGNKYSFAITGGALNGSAAGAFYGPTANETAGVYQAGGGGISLLGSYGAHH